MSKDIKMFNAVADVGLQRFTNDGYTIDATDEPIAVILRSENLHEYDFPESVIAVARAGAGTNNIPVKECAENGVVVFNTPGANANAVKELVLASLLISVRPIIQGAEWVQTLSGNDVAKQVEAEKKRFAGIEIQGKNLGVIGLGAIGAMVANDAYRLGMNVTGYDPYVSVDTAWSISRRVKRALSPDELFSTSDFITVHVPLNDKTKNLIGAEQLSKMKPTATLLNFSRGELVDTDAVIAALDNGQIQAYVTDFAEEKLLRHPKVTVLPHLGASTEEAEINCAKMASKYLKLYLETGNIVNSVNFPTVEMAFNSEYRFAIIHDNVPNMLGAISNTVAELGYNIDNLINRSRDEFAYTLVDLNSLSDDQVIDLENRFKAINSVIKVRVIHNESVR